MWLCFFVWIMFTSWNRFLTSLRAGAVAHNTLSSECYQIVNTSWMISCCSVFDCKLQNASYLTQERRYLLEHFFYCSISEFLVFKSHECFILCKPYLFPLLIFGSCSFFTNSKCSTFLETSTYASVPSSGFIFIMCRLAWMETIYVCGMHVILNGNLWLKKNLKICISLYFYQILIVIKTNLNSRAL